MNERVAKSEAFLTPMTLPSASCLGLTLMEFTTFRYVLQSNFGIKLQTMQKFSLLQQGTFNMTMMTFFGKKKIRSLQLSTKKHISNCDPPNIFELQKELLFPPQKIL